MNIRNDLHSGYNFQQYTRRGTLEGEESGGNSYKKHLSSERAASSADPNKKMTGEPARPRPPVTPIKQLQAASKDKEMPGMEIPVVPEPVDEPTRAKLEELVRRKKRGQEPCPFAGAHGECFRPDIRCGERAQYSDRETDTQHKKPHRCLYSPYFPGETVIVVESKPLYREFLLNTFKLFLHYEEAKIEVVSTLQAASDLLTELKLQDRTIGLIILSCTMLGNEESHLLNEIYDRNLAAEIILTGDFPEDELRLPNELLARMVDAGKPFINCYLRMPIPTEQFVSAINELFFGRFLS